MPDEVVARRREKCDVCFLAKDGVCVEQKRLHPDRPAIIEVGILKSESHCPLDPPSWHAWTPEVTMRPPPPPTCRKCFRETPELNEESVCVWCVSDAAMNARNAARGFAVPEIGAGFEKLRLTQNNPIGNLLAVTSLSLRGHHLARQKMCLESWKRMGLRIASVNNTEELEHLAELYPQVDEWVERNDPPTYYEIPTQKINTLANVATDFGIDILLINSDIETIGRQGILTQMLGKPLSLVAGIRHDYRYGSHATATRQRWGIDAFVLTPDMARSLPEMNLSIGRPVWDYWLPLHFRELGYSMDFIAAPFFYHSHHKTFWNRVDWNYGANQLRKQYGPDSLDYPLAQKFRRSLPYPP